MAQKINISDKGKTYKVEADSDFFVGRKLNEKIEGQDINPDLEGYELEITGASDRAGFPVLGNVEGEGLKRVLLKYGKAMKKQHKREGKKKRGRNKPKGLRLKKTVHGNTFSSTITQINLKVTKKGEKSLSEIFQSQEKKE